MPETRDALLALETRWRQRAHEMAALAGEYAAVRDEAGALRCDQQAVILRGCAEQLAAALSAPPETGWRQQLADIDRNIVAEIAEALRCPDHEDIVAFARGLRLSVDMRDALVKELLRCADLLESDDLTLEDVTFDLGLAVPRAMREAAAALSAHPPETETLVANATAAANRMAEWIDASGQRHGLTPADVTTLYDAHVLFGEVIRALSRRPWLPAPPDGEREAK